jgi:hypothetical protein
MAVVTEAWDEPQMVGAEGAQIVRLGERDNLGNLYNKIKFILILKK